MYVIIYIYIYIYVHIYIYTHAYIRHPVKDSHDGDL